MMRRSISKHGPVLAALGVVQEHPLALDVLSVKEE
jgi:hypothetical protein